MKRQVCYGYLVDSVNIVLISPYEIGRQPFGLAEPVAWLRDAGFSVSCIDLSIQRLDPELLGRADLVAIYIAMHTATRIAIEALPKIRQLAPKASLCVYGLYAPMNESLFREKGVSTVLGGECEPELVSLARRLSQAPDGEQVEPVISLKKISFMVPDRSGLPSIEKYAHLVLPDGSKKLSGFAETTRGCKYLCRHCPVVPVYKGTFRVIPAETVMQDIRTQVAAGARHISFGDPDFLNGPAHALKVMRALHREFPDVSYDATLKIEHIIRYPEILDELRETGCLFVTTAVESVDDQVLARLDKGHTNADFGEAVAICRDRGIALTPTFVPFTPWISRQGYVDLLTRLVELELVECVPPVQLSIRLLVPEGSWLLKVEGFSDYLGEFDPLLLGYPWKNPDPGVDRLQRQIQEHVAKAEMEGQGRFEIFSAIWSMAHQALGRPVPDLEVHHEGVPVPHLSEAWYCCAEPTDQQLDGF